LETLEDAKSFGWDFTQASVEGRIKFMRFAPQTSADELQKELKKVITKYNIQRICFDPISILALNQTDQGKIRQVVFDLSSLMKRMRVTTLFADESLEGESMQSVIEGEWTKTDILRFLSDSVTILYETGIAGFGDRAIRISKMRRTAHKRKPYGMRLTARGLEIMDEKGNIPTDSFEGNRVPERRDSSGLFDPNIPPKPGS
jgi:KaiC/GvpD/RAD55 family RecA-like ATPase